LAADCRAQSGAVARPRQAAQEARAAKEAGESIHEQALREADIEIPFPQRDLHIRSAAPALFRPASQAGNIPI
jgi:small-conductance mechanosensitive channel